MRTKRTKDAPSPAVVSDSDRDLLARAYKNGLIAAWRRDPARGYQLTFGDREDEYVEIANLSRHLEKLRASAT